MWDDISENYLGVSLSMRDNNVKIQLNYQEGDTLEVC